MKKMLMEDLKHIVFELRQLVEQPQQYWDQLDELNDWLAKKFGEYEVKDFMPEVNKFFNIRIIDKVDDFVDRVVKTEMESQLRSFKIDKSLIRGLRAAAIMFIYIQLKGDIELLRESLDVAAKLGRYDIE